MRHIPNAFTIARMVSSVFLLWVEPFSVWFMVLYFFCGISDVLDGFIARSFQLTSSLGATLDSVADWIFVCIVLYVTLPILVLPSWVLPWIGGIAFIKVCSLVLGVVRYGSLAFLHTYLNKITGSMLFGFPLFYSIFGMDDTAVVLCTVASVAAVEELVINITHRELKRDRKSIFFN
ncbi:CDP-alcohol phosphatidyltransferase family protein [Anaerotignum sp. MB30-C6]|uniref:CDP-alcohol phosphatidyltransferase family protein n=1 Tax=Anaerotignum sp. MB30-C6 TaxID=3070814 RepID=UPI0027DE2C1E|nr:CDP-alcohol phosphatidyltransferase family protein [Anaerotignum sp. MB30-C6]WMI81391.1 CDP-alcohol phosphatidyltransferase family protein [Anaerotignum sp. MB30-C6]